MTSVSRVMLKLLLVGLSTAQVPPEMTFTLVADSTTISSKGSRFTQFSFPMVSADRRCFFRGIEGKQEVSISKQLSPESHGGDGLTVIVDSQTLIPGTQKYFQYMDTSNGNGNCFLGGSTNLSGIFRQTQGGVIDVIATNITAPFTSFDSVTGWGDDVVFSGTSTNKTLGTGVYLGQPTVGLYRFTPLASLVDKMFIRNTSAPLTYFGLPYVATPPHNDTSFPLSVAFFASHTAGAGRTHGPSYKNVHTGLFIWTAASGLRLLLEDHISQVPLSRHSNNTFWDFTDVCVGVLPSGNLYIAFVGVGTQGGKGVYIHYVTEDVTVKVADTNDHNGVDKFEDFPFMPSCSGSFISFYGDAGVPNDQTRSSGIYIASPPALPPSSRKISFYSVITREDGLLGSRLLEPPQSGGDALAVPQGDQCKICFFAQFINGTFGVFSVSADLTSTSFNM